MKRIKEKIIQAFKEVDKLKQDLLKIDSAMEKMILTFRISG
ncbi:MAG: hypothetical protein ACMUJM_17380 [bacterium]